MPYNLKGRNFLTLLDYNREEIEYLIKLSENLKIKKSSGIKGDLLEDKNIALIFEKTSTRTRSAFVVAARDEGAYPDFLGINDIQLGKKESIADTARVLGRIFDGIEFRGYSHKTVEELAVNAGVPVWNGLTDRYHPTQVLADLLTIKENFGYIKGVNFAYLGDGRNNMANSLMIAAAIMGMNLTIVSPDKLRPAPALQKKCQSLARESGAVISLTNDPVTGVKNADVIYTDVWVSMGEEDKFAERINLLKPYQVTMEVIKNTNKDNPIFLHCLPAYHNTDTENAQYIYEEYNIEEMEVTDRVFNSKYSKVFDQAENRMHTIKAIMVATLGK